VSQYTRHRPARIRRVVRGPGPACALRRAQAVSPGPLRPDLLAEGQARGDSRRQGPPSAGSSAHGRRPARHPRRGSFAPVPRTASVRVPLRCESSARNRTNQVQGVSQGRYISFRRRTVIKPASVAMQALKT
jgi:hypothetical protein